MVQIVCDSWSDFESRLQGYFAKNMLVREQFVFRGVANSEWGLETTLDRFLLRFAEPNRMDSYRVLLEDFSKASLGLGARARVIEATEDEFELLARHHGLPSPVLDWTESVYVAAYFAFSDAIHDSANAPESVGIYMFNRQIAFAVDEHVQISRAHEVLVELNDHKLINDNPRAIEQRSVFYKVVHADVDLKEVLGQTLYQIVLPASERAYALAKLEEMGLNHRSLFRDLDAAAVTASARFVSRQGEPNV